MKKVPARNGGTFILPEKGETANPNGRPKGSSPMLRLKAYFKEHGLGNLSEKDILKMQLAALEASPVLLQEMIDANKKGKTSDLPTVFLGYAVGLTKDMAKGKVDVAEKILDRNLGKPTNKNEGDARDVEVVITHRFGTEEESEN
jgi:hypothetical protein